MMTIVESAANRSREAHEAVLAEMLAGRRAAARLKVGIVMRDVNGEWRSAAPWQGSLAATEAADRQLRLRLATRSLPPPIPLDAERARRPRAAEAETSINPLGRRGTADPPLRSPFWLLGFGRPR